MAPRKEDTVYLRNKRPNRVVFQYAGVRQPLSHRGSREDSVALPADALKDQTVARWLQIGQLEQISQEDYIALSKRRVDVLPNQYLKPSSIRQSGNAKTGVPMTPTGSDTGDIAAGDVAKDVRDRVSPKWNGDLMTTSEELEEFDYTHSEENTTYPSKHRDDEQRRGMGY